MRPNVVLVTFDTTRADHVGAFGYDKGTTPNVDRLAAEGTRFTHVYSTNPITLPAHTSLMTGTYPPFHGVRDNSAFVVRDDVTTLAEVLAARGYETAAFVGAFVLDSRFHLDQGFETYDDQVGRDWSRDELETRAALAFGFSERKANLVTLAALRWMEQRDATRPFFLWLHYFDAHEPRNPPEPHGSKFSDPYDAEIAFADEQLGRFLDELRGGSGANTYVVFTADHGEGLQEHGEPTHSLLLFDGVLRVPLVIAGPGIAEGAADPRLGSLVDVLPTILGRLGIPPSPDVQGVDLLGAVDPAVERVVYMESLVGFLQHGWAPLRVLRTATTKLIHGPAPRLYRIDEDPGEVWNVADREPETVADLTARLARFLEETAGKDENGSTRELDEESLHQLAALGYVGASVAAARRIRDDLSQSEGLADPHERRYLFDLFGIATERIKEGNVESGMEQLQEVIAADAENTAALTRLGMAYVAYAHQPELAQPLLERSIAIDPYQEEAHYFLARIHLAANRPQEARAQCLAILEFQPRSDSAHYELARIALSQGESREALDHLLIAYQLDPTNVSILLGLATFHGQRTEQTEAEKYLREALAVDPDNALVLYNVGVWYLQDGNSDRAVDYLRRSVAEAPDDAMASYVLGKLYVEIGRGGEGRPLLERAIRLGLHADLAARARELLAESPPS